MLLRQLRALTGLRIHATDGDIGHVHDVYFDDADWRVRYFHVDTRLWLGRHVLVAPTVVESVDWDGGGIRVSITREHVERSPDIDAHKPVSRQHHHGLDQYFQLRLTSSASLWEGEELAARLQTILTDLHAQQPATVVPDQPTDDPHLWSARAVHHYHVEGDHGDLGRVDDFLLHPETWALRYLVVEKGAPLRVNRLLVPVEAVHWMSWDNECVHVALDGAAKGGPASARDTTR